MPAGSNSSSVARYTIPALFTSTDIGTEFARDAVHHLADLGGIADIGAADGDGATAAGADLVRQRLRLLGLRYIVDADRRAFPSQPACGGLTQSAGLLYSRQELFRKLGRFLWGELRAGGLNIGGLGSVLAPRSKVEGGSSHFRARCSPAFRADRGRARYGAQAWPRNRHLRRGPA